MICTALNLSLPLESNTCYLADRPDYDVFLTDSICIPTPESDRYTAIDGGHMDIHVAVFLRNLENVTLDFQGATLRLHGRIQPFLLDNCKNICIKNVAMELDRSFYTECEILELTEVLIRLRIDRNRYPYRVKDGRMTVYADTWENDRLDQDIMFFQSFDRETREGSGLMIGCIGTNVSWPANAAAIPTSFTAEEDGNDLILRGKAPVHWHVGDTMVIAHENRELSTVQALCCEDITLENFRILNGPGMGILPIHTKNLKLDRLILTHDQKSPGIIANLADAVHAVACSGDLTMTDCLIEGMVDDAFNVHSNFYRVISAEGNRLTAVVPDSRMNSQCIVFAPGDTLSLSRKGTMEQTGVYTLQNMEILDNDTVAFYVDKPLAAHQTGDLIENLSAQPDITFRNCIFRKANTHLRLQTRGKLRIENCEFSLPILLTGDANYWMESSPVKDMILQNCVFTSPRAQIRLVPEVSPCEKEPYYHENIQILNNTFVTDHPVTGTLTNNLRFLGNTNSAGVSMTLNLTDSGVIEADNCTVIRE